MSAFLSPAAAAEQFSTRTSYIVQPLTSRKMKKDRFYILTALLLGAASTLSSCGGEPASDNLQPEATQGDYLGNDDLDTSADTTMTDTTTTETVQ